MTNSTKGEKPPHFPRWLRKWLTRGLAAFGLWAIFAATAWHMLGWKHQWLGAWGDSFAPLTGIASTLAVVFAVWSVHEQQKQLELQRKELELQRKELGLTREEMAAQRSEMSAQRAAQEESARQQAQANRIASLANVIAMEKAKLDAIIFAHTSNQHMKGPEVERALQSDSPARSTIEAAKRVIRQLELVESKVDVTGTPRERT